MQGYFLGAFLFLGIVFSLPATLGMASLALDLPVRARWLPVMSRTCKRTDKELKACCGRHYSLAPDDVQQMPCRCEAVLAACFASLMMLGLPQAAGSLAFAPHWGVWRHTGNSSLQTAVAKASAKACFMSTGTAHLAWSSVHTCKVTREPDSYAHGPVPLSEVVGPGASGLQLTSCVCAARSCPTTRSCRGWSCPRASYVLLGKGGAVLVIVICFMAVTSSGASEMVAVSSLFTFDVYRKYIHPKVRDAGSPVTDDCMAVPKLPSYTSDGGDCLGAMPVMSPCMLLSTCKHGDALSRT